MSSGTLVALALAVVAPPADSELKKKAEALVAQLGHPDYRDREKAARQLLDLGYPAKDAVLAGKQSSDTEISDRCKKLYPAIWRHGLEKRVQRFLDDTDGPIPDDLPAAARWLKLAGDGGKSREKYAEVVQAHAELLLEVELRPERLNDLYAEFIRGVYDRTRSPGRPVSERRGPTESELLLYFFLGAAGDVRPSTLLPGAASTYYTQFLNVPSVTARLSDEPVRKLYAGWLEKERYSIVLRRGIDLAVQNGVTECRPATLKIAEDRGSLPMVRSMALLGFARLGTKEQLSELEPFLADKLQIGTVVINMERATVQMRDVALGAALHLAGQDPADFGFERRPPSGLVISSYSYYAFGTDEKREAAHAKWKEWAGTNLKK